MLGALYLFLSWFLALRFLMLFLARTTGNVSSLRSLSGRPVQVPGCYFLFPAAFLVGTLAFTWITYILGYMFRGLQNPLLYGNSLTLLIMVTMFAAGMVLKRKQNKLTNWRVALTKHNAADHLNRYKLEYITVGLFLLITTYPIIHSFFIGNGLIHVGYSVYGDLGTHLSIIRSFSYGANFPTEFTHFPDGHIRYHFLFDFMVGNMEYLGLRLDWAYNLPSILSAVSFLMLLYTYAVILMGRRLAGVMTTLFFLFRSSFAFFTFASTQGSFRQMLDVILTSTRHIGNTPYEEIGLWAQKTFVNQRHFSYVYGIVLIALIILYPLYSSALRSSKNSADSNRYDQGAEAGPVREHTSQIRLWLKNIIFSKDAWLPQSYSRPITIGMLLGLSVFWNGALVIASLLLLFFISIQSKHKLEFLLVAVITIGLALCETAFFFGSESPALRPEWAVGFVAGQRSLTGILGYYVELLGVMPFVAAAGLAISPKGSKWLTFAFCTPLLMASLVKLAPDILINQKYVTASILLENIMAANFLSEIFRLKKMHITMITVILSGFMIITGIVDFFTLNAIDRNHWTTEAENPVLNWVMENTGPNEIFLTDAHVIHPILLAGRKIYYGYFYCAWSAGYDTDERERITGDIYGGTDSNKVRQLIKDTGIRYIVIENSNRDTAKPYKLNETLIRENFKLVYSNPQQFIDIYDTLK